MIFLVFKEFYQEQILNFIQGHCFDKDQMVFLFCINGLNFNNWSKSFLVIVYFSCIKDLNRSHLGVFHARDLIGL